MYRQIKNILCKILHPYHRDTKTQKISTDLHLMNSLISTKKNYIQMLISPFHYNPASVWSNVNTYLIATLSLDCTAHVSGLYSTCLRVVQYTSQGCTVHISWLYSTCLRVAQYTSQGCTVHISGLYSTHLRVVQYTSQGCTVHVSGLYSTC